MAQHPVLKPDKDVPEFVTPKMGYYYVLDAGSNIARVNWTVSGGSFSLGSSQTSIPGGNFYGITVYWDNVKSTNGSTPQGKLTAEVYYSSGVSGVQSASYTQKIKSLNGVTPPSLTSKTSTNLDYGVQNITVLLGQKFYYPGQTTTGDKIWLLNMSRLYLKDGKVVLKQVYLLLLLNPSILRQIMSVQEQSRYVV